jgi:serine/threonine protein phosphatase 1
VLVCQAEFAYAEIMEYQQADGNEQIQGRTFVVGDIHGADRALHQCLQRSGFNRENDRLIVLGDVCDGWPEVRETVDTLLSLPRCTALLGNHDAWALRWALTGEAPTVWTGQGGNRTIASYGELPLPPEHREFFAAARLWLELDGRLFVHAGFDPGIPLAQQDRETLIWDRELIAAAWQRRRRPLIVPGYAAVYLGHTPTQVFGSEQPLHLGNIWALDTGAGYLGRLTIMEIESESWVQSDSVPTLYPGIRGR